MSDVIEIMARAFWGPNYVSADEQLESSKSGMRDALAAASAAGWKLVPIEATGGMLSPLSVQLSPEDERRYVQRSFDDQNVRFHFSENQLGAIWRAMLAAAPDIET